MEKTPSTISDSPALTGTPSDCFVPRNDRGTATREALRDCPVAMRLYDRTADGLPLAAVAVANTTPAVASADESVRTKAVSAKRYATDFGERSLAALIVAHLSLVEDMLNVARPMKAEAMAMLAKKVAQTLLADDVSVTLADLQLIADRLAGSEVYGGLNAALVMRTVTDYIAEKGEAFANMRIEENARYKGSDSRPTCDELRNAERRRNREAQLAVEAWRQEVKSQK